MNYNDYQILSDETYAFMRDKFNKELTFDRETLINQTCFLLNECETSCLSLKTKLNKNLSVAIESAEKEIKKTLSTLNETFDIKVGNNVVREFDLFAFLKTLTNALGYLLNWNSFEDKEYYKKICKLCLTSVFNCIQNIIEAFGKSYLRLFKYM